MTTIAGSVMTFGSLLGYIITEGVVDRAAAKTTNDAADESKTE